MTRSMVAIGIWALCLGVLSTPIDADEPLGRLEWSRLHADQQLLSGEYVPSAADEPGHLRVVSAEPLPRAFPLAVWERPGISRLSYALRGRVRCRDVVGTGYLELWNHFPPDRAYFTRTLADRGPMQALRGTSDWREFVLPFYAEPGLHPEKLVLNLHLEGGGRVDLTDLELIEPAPDLGDFRVAGAWWSDRQGAFIGGLAGGFIGIVLGAIVTPLANKGRAPTFVLGALWCFIVAGVVCLSVGLVALILGQPYGVYYPLLLLGGLTAGVSSYQWWLLRSRMRDGELRRMTALDAG